MEEMKRKYEQTVRLLEALEKLDADQVAAFANAIVGAAMMNQLVKMNENKQTA